MRDGGNDDILRHLANYLVGEPVADAPAVVGAATAEAPAPAPAEAVEVSNPEVVASPAEAPAGSREAPMGSGVDTTNAALVAEAAEKVAKAEPLELLKKGDKVYIYGEPRTLQEDDEYWREHDGTAFESALQVDPEHGVSPVKLIDMRFIIALGELGGTMVRRQDLQGVYRLNTVKRLHGVGALPIISISHRGSSRTTPTQRRSTCSYSRGHQDHARRFKEHGAAPLASSSSERGRGGRSTHAPLSLSLSSSTPL